MTSELLYEKLIYDNEAKFYRLYLTVSLFREVYYVNIRKYFLSYEGEYIHSKEGITMECSVHNVQELIKGLLEIAALSEADEFVQEFCRVSGYVKKES